MGKIIIKHILKKWFGADHPNLDMAVIELENLNNNYLDKVVEDTKEYKPAYQDASEENLDEEGRCRFCGMAWHVCLCSHED